MKYLSVVEIVGQEQVGGATVPIYGRRLISLNHIVDIYDGVMMTDPSRSENFVDSVEFDTSWIRVNALNKKGEVEAFRVEGSIQMFEAALTELGKHDSMSVVAVGYVKDKSMEFVINADVD